MLKSVLCALLLCIALPAHSQTRVIDGDTLEISGTTYRLNGIDAPEYGQRCQSKAGLWYCGADALQKLADLTNGADVACTPLDEDPYGRTIATCTADGQDLSAAMTASGHAWAFVKYSSAYADEQTQAKAAGLGIWSSDNQTAWDYRAARWDAAKEIAPDGCPIKGNISGNGRIYHPPWSPWYNRTRVSLSKGERWFCDEAEAIEAGWRAPRWP